MSFKIDVSIITPAYNAEKYIARVYESLKKQKYKNFEWIVINDGSIDKTHAILQDFVLESQLKIKLINNLKNLGVAESRNKGLDIAEGEYICFLDADDVWHEEKLLLQLNYMRENSTLMSYMDYRHVDNKGNFIKVIVSPIECNRQKLLKSNHIGMLTCMIKKDIIKDLRFIKQGHEDYIFWLNLLSKIPKASKVITTKPLCDYTVSLNSISGKKLNAATWQWNIYRKVLKLNLITSIYYFSFYLVKGILKHKF